MLSGTYYSQNYASIIRPTLPPWLARTQSIEQRGHHVTCALIGTSRKLAAYIYPSSVAL